MRVPALTGGLLVMAVLRLHGWNLCVTRAPDYGSIGKR